MAIGLQLVESDILQCKVSSLCLETIQDMKACCHMAIGTLDNMLTVDKIESGYFIATKKDVSLVNFLQSEIKSFQNLVRYLKFIIVSCFI